MSKRQNPGEVSFTKGAQVTLHTGEAGDDLINAIYNTLVIRPSSITQLYKKNAIVDRNSVLQLALMLRQAFDLHTVRSSSFKCNVSLSSGQTVELTTEDEFKSFDGSQSDYVKDFSFEFKYVIEHEVSNKPEEYTVEVSTRPYYRSLSMVFHLFEDAPLEISSTMRVQVGFSNYIIGINLKSVLDNWVESLDEIEDDNQLLKYRWIYSVMSKNLFRLTILMCSISAMVFAFSRNFDFFTLENLTKFTCVVIVATHFIYFVNKFAAAQYERLIRSYEMANCIDLTRGDKKNREKVLSNNQRILSNLRYVFVGIPVAALLNLISAFVYGLL